MCDCNFEYLYLIIIITNDLKVGILILYCVFKTYISDIYK